MLRLKVVLSTWGRFHFFHLARQIERRGWLEAIFTIYPRFKLRDEGGIPVEKIKCDWVLEAIIQVAVRSGIPRARLEALEILRVKLHDRYLLKRVPTCDAFIALSGSGQVVGPMVQRNGGIYICDRGSAHIEWQLRLLEDEYRRFGEAFRRPPEWFIAREIAEYATADRIVVPSQFAARSYLEQGLHRERVEIVPYGANLSRFSPVARPPDGEFVVLFVGRVGLSKGIPYLLEAFHRFKHPHKRLKIIGDVGAEIRRYLARAPLDGVQFLGPVRNAELAVHYSSAHVFVLPSIDDGFGMVMGEALACACPVIATTNTGAQELFDHGIEGFIVPPRDPSALADAMTALADDPSRRARMREAALARVHMLNGWDNYGTAYERILLAATGRSEVQHSISG
jgi:starch synthase